MKAILVLNDMPECCADCPCSFFERSNPKLNLICGATQEHVNNVGKPDWCPLKPMPSKIGIEEALEIPRSGCIADVINSYNACIDEILGDKE